MTSDDARALVLQCLADTAPDADLAALRDEDDLHATLDLDSMDRSTSSRRSPTSRGPTSPTATSRG